MAMPETASMAIIIAGGVHAGRVDGDAAPRSCTGGRWWARPASKINSLLGEVRTGPAAPPGYRVAAYF
jgi:hypothetical protein